MSNYIMVVDFGGQYNQLIARRVREIGVYSEVISYKNAMEKARSTKVSGIILTGGPDSVYSENSPKIDREIFELGVPVLGICYGMQIMAQMLGGSVRAADKREYGKTFLKITKESKLFKGIENNSQCWMSHNDFVDSLPEGFIGIAETNDSPIAAFEHPEKKLFGIQFHGEVEHTPFGRRLIENFVKEVCELKADWDMGSFAKTKIEEIKKVAGDSKVICGLSGGVDSSVAATLVYNAIGKNLTCIFVDHGLMRKDEGDQVEDIFCNKFHMNFIRVDARKRFLDKLAGVSDPETKRKIIGEEFIRVFEEEASKLKGAEFLVQGTVYPDVIESGTDTAQVIKSHHNVGGLPEDMKFKLIEPLRELFKDEVRAVGSELGLPDYLVWRQPFPGPGLGIRVIGDITEEKLHIVRESDAILRDEIAKAGLDREIWQYFTILTNIQSVGVMGDERTYSNAVGIRAVTSVDGMTSDWARIPYDVMDRISSRIVNEVPGVNRIVYDVTTKPPSTIEWE